MTRTWQKAKRLFSSIAISSLLLCAPAQAARSAKSTPSSGADAPGCKSCLSQAATLFAADQINQALELLANWSPKCPKTAQLHLLYSTILIREGKNLAEAERQAQLAVAARPDSQAAHLQCAMTLMANGKYQLASQEFRAVTDINPASFEAWSALADLYKRLHEDEEAAKAATRAANLEPSTRAVRLAVLINLKRSGNFVRAKKELQRLLRDGGFGPEFDQSLAEEALQIGSYAEAIEGAERASLAYPNSSEPVRILALAQYLSHQYQASESSASKLLSLSGGNPDGLALKALSMMAQGKTKDGSSFAAQAAAADAHSGLSQVAVGLANSLAGEYAKAQEAWRACAATGPRTSVGERLPETLAHLQLYRFYRQQGALDDAGQEARAISADPRFKSTSLGAQSIVLMLDSPAPQSAQQAARLLKDAVEFGDRAPEVLLAQAYEQFKSGNNDQARRLAEQAAAIEPASSGPITLLAQIAESKGDAEGLTKTLQSGLAAFPYDQGLLCLKSKQMLKENKAPEAIKLLLPLSGDASAPQALFLLGEASEKTGAMSDALKYYKQSAEGLGAEQSLKANAAVKRIETLLK